MTVKNGEFRLLPRIDTKMQQIRGKLFTKITQFVQITVL